MKQLYLSFAPPEKWRNEKQAKNLKGDAWKIIRQKILTRDNFTCVFCSFYSTKYQIVDHIDGDPENNNDTNLQVVCQMCNLIKHSDMGCDITGVVDLYKYSKYNQNEIIKITREMRAKGISDKEIIKYLDLREKAPFNMEREYLRGVFGFVTSRESEEEDDIYNHWLEYQRSSKQDKDSPK